ncbi:uncharacterized protein LOC135829978 [Sycon ciliatum]|uniref:uncharacterized protein LOC135829978 n=1 Tax=Sycon ciliatum TaxID=27933 RepID=UPI0031F6DE41|eukprot:scpid47819/ scgid8361/ 
MTTLLRTCRLSGPAQTITSTPTPCGNAVLGLFMQRCYSPLAYTTSPRRAAAGGCSAILPSCMQNITTQGHLARMHIPGTALAIRSVSALARQRCTRADSPRCQTSYPGSSASTSGASHAVFRRFSSSWPLSDLPPELATKWRHLWLKMVGAAIVVVLASVLSGPILADLWSDMSKTNVPNQNEVPMPASLELLTGKELARFTGRFVRGETVLVGPVLFKTLLAADQSGFMSQVVNPFTHVSGYQVVVPFYCNETKSKVLVNIGWLAGVSLQRYLRYHHGEMVEKQQEKGFTMLGMRMAMKSDKLQCWDGREHTVTDLAAECKTEPFVMEIIRGPFLDYDHPRAGALVTTSYLSWRKIKNMFGYDQPRTIQDCIEPEGTINIMYTSLLPQLMAAFTAVALALYVRRGFKNAGTFYRQYLQLKAETALSKPKRKASSRQQLKG